VWLYLWDHFSITLTSIICGPDPKMCIYTDDVCNQEVFQISFAQFVRETKHYKSEHNWQKENVVLSTVSLKTMVHPCNSVFTTWHLHPCFTFSLYSLVQDLRCLQWWGFIMQSRLGHRVVWYIVVNILEELSWCVFTCTRKMEAVCPDRNVGAYQSDYTVP
jgi:hypothetical protein